MHFLAPAEVAAKTERFLYEGRARDEGANEREILSGFADRTDPVLQLIEGYMPNVLESMMLKPWLSTLPQAWPERE